MSPAIRSPEETPAIGLFRSASGRTEITLTPDNTLDIRVRTGQDILTEDDAHKLEWVLQRFWLRKAGRD